MKWITRERPKIDRIACPWLVARFIDSAPEFVYVPADRVLADAERLGATPFDVPGVELGHHGERCSFDAFIDKYHLQEGLRDAALDRLALIVRAADCGHPENAVEAPGLLALSDGLRLNFDDDQALLAQGMVVYDALYAHCAQAPIDRLPAARPR